MIRTSTALRLIAASLLAITLAILTTANVASANPCQAGDEAISKEEQNYRRAKDKAQVLETKIANIADNIRALKKIASQTSATVQFWAQQAQIEIWEQEKKKIEESPEWKAWQDAQDRMKNLRKRVAEGCPEEARERWEREKAWVNEKVPIFSGSGWTPTCAGGKALIAEAGNKGYTTAQGVLIGLVTEQCAREAAEAADKAAAAASASTTAAAPGPTRSSGVATCAEGKARLSETSIDDPARGEILIITANLCDREEAAAAASASTTAAAPGPTLSTDKATCAEGKAAIAEAKSTGDQARLDSLMTIVPVICGREAAAAGGELVPTEVPTCAVSKTRVQDLKQAVDSVRGSEDKKQFRYAMDNLTNAMVQAQSICQREANAATQAKPQKKSGRKRTGGRRKQPPSYDPQAAAAAAAAIIGIIQGATSSRSRGGGGGVPRRRCHRDRFGRIHCGSN